MSGGLVLHKVLYVLNFKYNLISVNQLCASINYGIYFTSEGYFVQDLSMKGSWQPGKLEKGLYCLQDSISYTQAQLHLSLDNRDMKSSLQAASGVQINSNKVVHDTHSDVNVVHRSNNKTVEEAKK